MVFVCQIVGFIIELCLCLRTVIQHSLAELFCFGNLIVGIALLFKNPVAIVADDFLGVFSDRGGFCCGFRYAVRYAEGDFLCHLLCKKIDGVDAICICFIVNRFITKVSRWFAVSVVQIAVIFKVSIVVFISVLFYIKVQADCTVERNACARNFRLVFCRADGQRQCREQRHDHYNSQQQAECTFE